MAFGQYSHGHRREGFDAAAAATARSTQRVRHVFDSSMAVAHRWAHQTQDSARYRDNFYFEGRALYSYGQHFLLGFIMPNPKGEPVALLNTDSHSVTTGRHKGDADSATSHMTQYNLPGLTAIRRELQTIADAIEAKETGKRFPHAGTQARLLDWLRGNAPTIEQRGRWNGAHWLLDLAGISPAAVRKAVREREASDKADDIRAARRERDGQRYNAKLLNERPDADWRASWPDDGRRVDDDYHKNEGARFAKAIRAARLAAKGANWPKIAAKLWAREKEYRAHLAGRDGRIQAAIRKGCADEIRAWRNGAGERPQEWRFSAFPAIKRAIERAAAAERRANRLEAFRLWQAGEGKRPSPDDFDGGSPEAVTIQADIASERAARNAAYLAWKADNSQPRPLSTAFTYDDSPLGKWTCRDGIERYEFQQGFTAADAADRLAAWPFHAAKAELVAIETAEKAERERIEREARAAEQLAKDAEAIASFRAGARSGRDLGDGNGGSLIRARYVERDAAGEIIEGTLETSQGADVPLVHAIKAFRFVKLVRGSGKPWKRNGKTIRVGHYQIDKIDSNGFDAGCHRINWPEIERLAAELGVLDAAPDESAVSLTAHAA